VQISGKNHPRIKLEAAGVLPRREKAFVPSHNLFSHMCHVRAAGFPRDLLKGTACYAELTYLDFSLDIEDKLKDKV